MVRARALELQLTRERWPLAAPFRITGRTWYDCDVLVATLSQRGAAGRGEAAGVSYRGETVETMAAQIEAVRATIESGVDRQLLQSLLPPGGARNALDCALWELESHSIGRPVWQLAGLAAPRSLACAVTLGADSPAAMAAGAVAWSAARVIKMKLTGEAQDAERVRAVRDARPDVRISVDGNEGFTRSSFEALLPALLAARVYMVEQPFPGSRPEDLDGFESPVPLCADESVQGFPDLAALPAGYRMVNIKLDKCGGLTEALRMAEQVKRMGLQLMVGNMIGTSLAMAPAFLLGQLCDVVDLDGPLLLKSDRAPAADYRDGRIWCAEDIWGAGGSPSFRPFA